MRSHLLMQFGRDLSFKFYFKLNRKLPHIAISSMHKQRLQKVVKKSPVVSCSQSRIEPYGTATRQSNVSQKSIEERPTEPVGLFVEHQLVIGSTVIMVQTSSWHKHEYTIVMNYWNFWFWLQLLVDFIFNFYSSIIYIRKVA